MANYYTHTINFGIIHVGNTVLIFVIHILPLDVFEVFEFFFSCTYV